MRKHDHGFITSIIANDDAPSQGLTWILYTANLYAGVLNRMQYKTRSLFLAMAIVACSIVMIPRCGDALMNFDRGLHNAVMRLNEGTHKSEFFEILGEPWKSDTKCCLPQYSGFEDEFAVANASEAVEFFTWINGANHFYCIGFDDDGRMTIVVEGSS